MKESCRLAARLTCWNYDYYCRIWDPEYPAPTVVCAKSNAMRMKILERKQGEKDNE